MKQGFYFILLMLIGCVSAAGQFSRADGLAERRLLALHRMVEPLYRKPTRRELDAVAPNPELFDRYAEFLRRPDTGLVKLIAGQGCAGSTKIVVASDNCMKYSMPGAGSSFSFRMETYRIARLADLTFIDNSFQATGILLHGILVNIGDVPLEDVTPQTGGLKFLFDFKPATGYEKGKEIDRRLIDGVRQDGFLYRRGLYIAENATFVLRSIAYGGKSFQSIRGLTYNEIEFDRRKDVIVAFRIVEKDGEGNVTILWKKLQDKDSPVLKRGGRRPDVAAGTSGS